MADPNVYDVGDRTEISASFTDPNSGDEPIDPTTVKVHYKKPDGTVTTKVHGTDVEVVKEDTGDYKIEITLDAAGVWRYRWEGEGAAIAAEEGQLLVRAQEVVPA